MDVTLLIVHQTISAIIYQSNYILESGYGVPTPPPPSYNTPNAGINSGYGTPRPGFNGGISTPRPSYGGGTIAPRPVGPTLVSPQPVNNNFVNNQQTLSQTFPASNNYNAGNNFQNQVRHLLFYLSKLSYYLT